MRRGPARRARRAHGAGYLTVAKLDRLKEEIGWQKAVFVIAMVTDISLVGWTVLNYDTSSPLLRVLCIAGAFVITGVVAFVSIAAYAKLGELEDE